MGKISIIGISTMEGNTGLQIVYFDMEYNGIKYKWKDYSPHLSGDELSNYLENKKEEYESDIDEKEALWAAHPKTKEIISFDGQKETVPVSKDEIVKPELAKVGNYLV